MTTNREAVVERAAKAIWLRNNTQLHSATEEQLSEWWAAEPEPKKENKWRPFARAALSIAEEAVRRDTIEECARVAEAEQQAQTSAIGRLPHADIRAETSCALKLAIRNLKD